MKTRRRGLSLIEVLVAVAILAVSLAAILTLASSENTAGASDRDRLLAAGLLRELEECFAHRPRRYFGSPHGLAFPETLDQFGDLHASAILEHPMITPANPEEARDGIGRALAGFLATRKARRAILLSAPDGPDGPGVVTFLVEWESPSGGSRTLRRHRVVR